MNLVEERMRRIAEGVAGGFGATASLMWLWPERMIRGKLSVKQWFLHAGAVAFIVHLGIWPLLILYFHRLSLIGFLWAALGGAGTALPAVLDRERLTALFVPVSAVFIVWVLQETLIEPWLRLGRPTLRQRVRHTLNRWRDFSPRIPSR